jgi:Na+-driven multidrug efflux pump
MVSSTGVDRLALYLSYVQIWVYPALVVSFAGTRGIWATRGSWLAMISSIVMAVFLAFFLYGNHAAAYVPYKNFLIDD